jgi:secreted trypsin-like serine protease
LLCFFLAYQGIIQVMKPNIVNYTQNLGWAIALAGSTFAGVSPSYASGLVSVFDLKPTIYAGDPNNTTTPDSADKRIIKNSDFAGVGTTSTGCTASAISFTAAISAAHCFDRNSPNVDFVLNGTRYAGVVSIFPGAVFPFDDVAIISLNQSLPSDTPIYELYRKPVELGSVIEFIGYGDSGNGVNGNSSGFNSEVKRLGANVADLFFVQDRQTSQASLSFNQRNALISFDFDGTDSSSSFSGGLTLGNDIESTYGGGDSGSPNFIDDGGVLKIAGVSTGVFGINQRGTPYFGSGGIFTDVSSYASFIDQTIEFTPVPFEFSPAIGVGLLGVWGVIAKLKNK